MAVAEVKYNEKKRTVKGTAGDDIIDANEYGYVAPTEGKNKDKGLTITGGKGNDSIIGTMYNDVIKGGDGNDTITGTLGIDKITGGKGENRIVYTYLNQLDGDMIYLTKGENLTIDVKGITTNPDNITYRVDGKNLQVTVSIKKPVLIGDTITLQSTSKTFTIMNYGKKDITGNYGSVKLVYGNGENDYIDLKQNAFTVSDVGTFHNDIIDRHAYFSAKNKGLKINGKAGNDSITGTGYADTIKGGDGDDTITGGAGNDKLYGEKGNNTFIFRAGDGNDTIYSGKGDDTLVFDDISLEDMVFSRGTTKKTKNDLIIQYGNGDSVTIKNYYKTSNTVNHIIANEGTFDIETAISAPIMRSLSRGDEELSVNLTSAKPLQLTLTNPFTGENYTYTISTDHSQTVNIKFLLNGRLRINGNYLNIVAGENQVDDIILWGDNNTVSTIDLNDIVRIGGAVDSNSDDYFIQSNSNTVNTGSGNDYIVYFGGNNEIDAGEGDDLVLSMFGSPISGVSSADVRANNSNISGSLDGVIGWFDQGYEGGDCRLLALIQSLSNKLDNIDGESYSDYVTITQDGTSYNVIFNNYHNQTSNSCTVTSAELDGWENVFGDLDVVLTDIALNKLLAQNQDYAQTSVEDAYYNTLSDYFFGNELVTYIPSDEVDYITQLSTYWSNYCNSGNTDIYNVTIGIFEENDNYELGIITGHAYALMNLTEDYISLLNVWDSADILNLDLATFCNMDTGIFVYGYGSDGLIANGEGCCLCSSSVSIDDVAQDMVSWQVESSSSDIQPLTGTDNNTQNDYLAINSIIQDDLTCQMTA